MKKNLLKTLLLLCALIAGSSNVWATDPVSSVAPSNNGTYVVAAYVNSKYYALPNGTVSGGQITGTEITLNALNKVNTSDASGKTWTLEEGTGDNAGKYYVKYTSGNKTYYLYKNGTGKTNYNFKVSEGSMNYWSFTTNGTAYTVAAVDRGDNNVNVNCNDGTFSCRASATPIILLQVGNVSALSSIALSGTYKTAFYVDDTFNYDGLVVTATFADESSMVVTPTSVSSPDMSTAGVKTITVTYTINAVTKTTTYDITVTDRPKFTVTFSDGGSLTEASAAAGIELPSRSDTGDYTFVGWSESNVLAGSSAVTTIDAGETYYPNADCTLYPVYSYSAYGVVEEWQEISDVPTAGEYVIASNNNYAMKASVSSSRFENVEVTINAGSPAKLAAAPADNYIWQVSKSGDYFYFKNGNNYAGATGSNNQGALITDATSKYVKWTIKYSTGFTITNYGMNQDKKNETLRNNGTYGWASYGSSTGEAPRLFKKTMVNKATTLYTSDPVGLVTISINAACTDGTKCYGTYSNSSAFIVPADLTVSEINIDKGQLVIFDYTTGDVVPTNTGVMVSSLGSGNITVSLSDEAGSSLLDGDNMLKPSGDAGISAANMTIADTKFYRLTMHNGTTIGFWWGAENGAAFALGANKAYLAIPNAAMLSRSCLWFGEENITAIEAVKAQNVVKGEYFNLAGQRVAQPSKGLYIMNGKKVIIK